jgi:hypothetical protein
MHLKSLVGVVCGVSAECARSAHLESDHDRPLTGHVDGVLLSLIFGDVDAGCGSTNFAD